MANPIIQRELIGLLRTRMALVFQVVFVLVLSALVVSRWPPDGAVDLAAQQSQQVLRVFGYGIMVGLILLSPIFPATSIVRERRRGTLLLLINSPLTAPSIFLGKLIGGLGFVVLLVILSLPAAAACYAMGGLNLYSQFLPLYVVLLVMAAEYTSLGLLVSTFASTAESAVRITYFGVAGLTLLPVVLHQFLFRIAMTPPWTFLGPPVDWMRNLSPLPAVMEMLGNGDVNQVTANLGSDMARRTVLLSVLLMVGFSVWTVARLNTRLFDKARAAGKITDERSFGVQAYRRIMYLWFFDPQRRSGMIGDGVNPVMVKEVRTRRFGRLPWMIRLAVVSLILALSLMLAASRESIGYGVGTVSGVVVFLQIGLIIVLTPTLACGLISGERESGGWALLQATPLSAGAIIRGKLMSVVIPLFLILLGTLPAYAMMAYIDAVDFNRVPAVMVTLVLTAVIAVLVSAASSSLFKRTAEATTFAFSVLVSLWGGTLLIAAADGAPLSHGFVEKCLTINPLATALALLRTPSFEEYHLVPANWWLMGAMGVLSIGILVVRTRQLTRPQ